MRIKKIASIYSIFMGISMIGMWVMFYITGSIPELETKPIELGMHLLAEIATSVFLIAGGIGVLSAKKWGMQIYYISMGMLIYTLLMSPGYFLQNGEYGLVAMFGVFILAALILVVNIIHIGGRASKTSNN